MSAPARHLHAVDVETGERFDHCPECARRDDEIKGLERALKAEIRRHEELKRDKEAEALAHHLWPLAVIIWQAWQKATGHTRGDFNGTRFWLVEPFLRKKKYGPEMCLRAVAGRAYDHFSAPRKNGTIKHFDEWERIFKDVGELEESASRVPKGWRDDPVLADALEQIKVRQR